MKLEETASFQRMYAGLIADYPKAKARLDNALNKLSGNYSQGETCLEYGPGVDVRRQSLALPVLGVLNRKDFWLLYIVSRARGSIVPFAIYPWDRFRHDEDAAAWKRAMLQDTLQDLVSRAFTTK